MRLRHRCHAPQRATTLPNRKPVADWCAGNVVLPYGSSRAPTFSPDLTPWIREPLAEIFDNFNREIVLLAPVGSGKSTAIEAMLCYILAEDPGPTLITAQTDEDIADWAETRAWPVLRSTNATAHLFPSERDKIRKTEILFPHMPVFLTGANMSGLQSKSIRWLLGDECWMWKRGMIEEFRNRMHRRWNGRRVLMGQAGIEGDDYHRAWNECEQREWSFQCPSCGSVQPFSFQQLMFPSDGTNAERALACRYHCAHCPQVFEDTTTARRSLANSGRYIAQRAAQTPGHVGFHYNALTLWESPWSDIVAAWLNAQDALAKGDPVPLQQFLQKQLAEFWREDLSISRPDILRDDRRVEDFAAGQRIDGEARRFATIDCQRDHFWLCIRAWRSDASSVGLWYGRVNAEETIAELISRYHVEPHGVFIDTGYDSGRIYDIICRYGWCGIRGDSAKDYPHHVGKRTIRKPFSKIHWANAPCGERARYFFIASDQVKNVLAKLRSGEGADWRVLSDIHPSWSEQIDSEAKEEFIAPRDNQTSYRWVRKKRDNHAWDCESYQVAAALVLRLFGND